MPSLAVCWSSCVLPSLHHSAVGRFSSQHWSRCVVLCMCVVRVYAMLYNTQLGWDGERKDHQVSAAPLKEAVVFLPGGFSVTPPGRQWISTFIFLVWARVCKVVVIVVKWYGSAWGTPSLGMRNIIHLFFMLRQSPRERPNERQNAASLKNYSRF